MVETISPVVHGGRNRSYWTSIAAHVSGATLAAVVFGAGLGAAGHLASAPWGIVGPLLVATAALVYLLREAFALPIPTLDRKAQVPEWWRTFYSHTTASFLYGAGLGIGFLTYLTFGTYVVVALAALVSGDVMLGALYAGVFGVARSTAVAVVGGTDPDVIGERITAGRAVNTGALALVGIAAVTASF